MATKFKSFTGSSAIEALKKAQDECGDNAILVTTKLIQPKTINKEAIYEIVVSVEEENIEKKQSQVRKNPYVKPTANIPNSYNKDYLQPLKNTYETSKNDEVLLNISKAAKEISEIANVNTPQIAENYSKKLDDVAKQVNFLHNKISMIADMIWDEKAPLRNNLIIPPEFSSIYKLAKQSGMKSQHLDSIMQTTIECMPANIRSNPVAVKNFFYTFLRKMLPCRVQKKHNTKQKIMMLVGPTGVGKTTTLAKLAARFAYIGDVRLKTGIITLDTYRIGAVEQLFQYAKLMKLPILDVINEIDFSKAIKSLSQCDIILVDTIGSSQYDKDKLNKLESLLRNSGAQIDVNLVLSAGSKIEDLLEIYDNFSFLNIDTMIITKFDETKMFGNVFSLIYETKIPVSYFSIGQEVPDDLLEAKSEFLVECILGGYKNKANDNG